MRVIPRITADFEDYPELRVLGDAAIRRVVELMEIHDIIELRRIRKVGVFDHPYTKDVVTPIGIPVVPNTVRHARYSAGVALLDYLETIGIEGIALEVTKDDAANIATLWDPPKQTTADKTEKQESLDPVPMDESGANSSEQQENTASEPKEENSTKETK